MIQSLNGLRFIFAVIICCGHYIFTTPYAGEMTGKALFFDTTAAVAFFFILSGFSLACGFSDKMKDGTFEPLPFLKKRFFKLYPMHFLTLIIILLLFAKTYVWNGETVRNLILHILLLHSYVPDVNCYFAFNRVSWYLSTLFSLYVFFAFCMRGIFKSRHPMLLLAALSAFFSVALVLFAHFQKAYDDFVFNVFPPTRLLHFFIGAWLFLFYKKLKSFDFKTWQLTAAEIISIAVLVFSWMIRKRIPIKYQYVFLYVPACALIILVFALGDKKGLFSKIAGSKVLVSLGSVSFPFYMIHLFCQNIASYIVPQKFYSEHPFLFFAFYLFFTICASYILDFLVVRKFTALVTKKTNHE